MENKRVAMAVANVDNDDNTNGDAQRNHTKDWHFLQFSYNILYMHTAFITVHNINSQSYIQTLHIFSSPW